MTQFLPTRWTYPESLPEHSSSIPLNFLYDSEFLVSDTHGPTSIYRQRPHQLGTHRLPILKYELAWSCDHSSSDSRDRERACGHRPYTVEHLAIFQARSRLWVVHQELHTFPGCNCWSILDAVWLLTHNLLTMLPGYNSVLAAH